MPSALSLPLNAIAHQEDAVHGIYSKNIPTDFAKSTVVTKSLEFETQPKVRLQVDNISLSFAYDAIAKSLSIIMTDKASGEVVRKISYNPMSSEVHRTNKLQGLLLDQLA